MSPRNAAGFWRIALLRAVIFLALWLVLTLGNPVPIFRPESVAAVAATWTSLYLLTRERRPPVAARNAEICAALFLSVCRRWRGCRQAST